MLNLIVAGWYISGLIATIGFSIQDYLNGLDITGETIIMILFVAIGGPVIFVMFLLDLIHTKVYPLIHYPLRNFKRKIFIKGRR